MDKVVEKWVTTSKPLESRGLWKRFVQERNQVLPQAKPSKSISDKYQDYLKAESYLEPKSQMFVRDEMGFDEGGLATPKRGLVDGPGSYSNKETYAGRPTKLYSSLKDAVTPERYEQIKFANPEMSEKQLEKSYKKLTRGQKYDLISLQKGGFYKNKSGMINPTKSKVSEYSGRIKTLKNFKIVEEAGTINPVTEKPFTQEEFFKITPSKRTYYLKLASDPTGFREEQRADYKKRVDEGRIKVSGYNNTPIALRGERNGLLRFLRTAADEGNPNYEIVKRKGEIIGVKDKKANVVYRSAIFTKPYSEKNHLSIHEHPDYRKVHNPYYKTQGGKPGLFELAKEFKFTSPNTTLGTYFAKYGEVPSYSDMYNFLTRPKSKATKRRYNALEKHHISLVKGSPTKNIQLTLHDKNQKAEFLLRSYDNPNSPYYKDQKYMDRELKKINARLKVGNKILGGAPLTGEKALGTAKRETVRLFKERLKTNPNLVREMTTALKRLCPNKASGGRVGMKVAGSVGVKCGADRFKQVFKDPSKGTQAEKQLVGRILKSGGSAAGRKALYVLGPAGVGIDALIEGAIWGDDVLKGSSGAQAYKDHWLSYLDPTSYTGGLKVSGDRYNETEIAKKYKGDTAKFFNLRHAIEDKYRLENKLKINEESDVEGYGITLTPNQQNRLKEANTIIENAGGEETVYSLIKEDSPLYDAARISSEKFEEVGPGKDWDRKMLAKGPLAQRIRDEKRKKEMDLYPTYDMFITPSEYKAMDLEQQREAKNVIPQASLTERAGLKKSYAPSGILPTDDLSQIYWKDTGMSLLDEYNLGKKWNYLINQRGMTGTQDRFAGGGIAGVRRPHAIPPKSGPMPQGGGLSSMFNRVRKW